MILIIYLLEIISRILGDFVNFCRNGLFFILLTCHFSCSSIFFYGSQISNLKWDKTSAIDGEEITLSAEVSDSIESITFTIWKVSDDTASDKPFAVFEVHSSGGKASASWTYRWEDDPDSPLSEVPEFFFTVSDGNIEKKSGTISVTMDMTVEIDDENGNPQKNIMFMLIGPNGIKVYGKTDEKGFCEVKKLVPGKYEVKNLNE
ncbi:MAG: hypothetical protein KA015_07320 [Spirochaetes bacterium]|nr:hypothetical protein [Spirochaetota bacterium]